MNAAAPAHRRLLVLGGTGYLGRSIVKIARNHGHDVAVLARGQQRAPGAEHVISGDLRAPSTLLTPMNDRDAVINAAALAHVLGGVGVAERDYFEINAAGAEHAASAAAESGVAHFVHISTVAVYGPTSGHVQRDESSECRPVSPYARSKLEGEQRTIAVAASSGMNLTILRLATLFGEEDPGNIARLARLLMNGRFAWIGDGGTTKSLIYRNDAARACLLPVAGSAAGVAIYNVVGLCASVRQIVEAIAQASEARLPKVRVPAAPALATAKVLALMSANRGPAARAYHALATWLSDEVYDGSRFGEQFDFRPETDLSTGLRREVQWLRNH